jgi:hypothetical protein
MKPYEITGLRTYNTHCRNFKFKNPTDPSDWDAFCAENDVTCSHDDLRAFLRSEFDCMLCREKLDNVLYSFSDPIPCVEICHEGGVAQPIEPNGGVVNLQVSFEKHVDPTWTPLAVDYASSVRLGFTECERLVQEGLSVDMSKQDALEQQNHCLLAIVSTLVRTLHAVNLMQAVAIFDTFSPCPVLTHIYKQTDLLMLLLHTQLGRARGEITKALGFPVGPLGFVLCPVLTDINTPYFTRWEKDNEARSQEIRQILLENNRKRLLHFRGWAVTTSAILAMPQFTTLAQQAQNKWRLIDSDDFSVAHNEISDKSVYMTAFELVLGCLSKKPPPGCPLDIPTIQMDATMLDSRTNTAFTTCVAGYHKIIVTNQAQMVPSCFPLTSSMKTEIETTVRRLCDRFQAYEKDFHALVASMPTVNDDLYARAKLRFIHAHSIVSQGVILRRLACFAKYLHDISSVLRGVECGEISKCLHRVIACVQYNRVATRFSEFVVDRLEIELTSETPVAPKSGKKKKSSKKIKSVEIKTLPPPELKKTPTQSTPEELRPLPTPCAQLLLSNVEPHSKPPCPPPDEDDGQGEWEKEGCRSKCRKDRTVPVQQVHLRRQEKKELCVYVPPTGPIRTHAVPQTETAHVPVPVLTLEPVEPTAVPSEPVVVVEPTTVPPSKTNEDLAAQPGGKRRRRRAKSHVTHPVTMQILPRFIGIPGYDPSMFFMHTDGGSIQQTLAEPTVPVAMCSLSGTVLYGHFLPPQLVCTPLTHF